MYSGAEDPSRLVATNELSEDEVLQHLGKILKGVSVILPRVAEHDVSNLPLVASNFMMFSEFFFILLHFYSSIELDLLQDCGWNFDDMPLCLQRRKLRNEGAQVKLVSLILRLFFLEFP